MGIIETSNKEPRFRVIAVVSLIGLLFTILFVIVLIKYGIYEYEYKFGRDITILIFITFVIVPLGYYALLVFEQKVFRPVTHRIFHRWHQRRIEKYGYKKVSREDRYNRRINKVLGQNLVCLIALIYLSWGILISLILGVRRIQIPEGDLGDDDFTMILCSVSLFVGIFLSFIISVRLFKKKKGRS